MNKLKLNTFPLSFYNVASDKIQTLHKELYNIAVEKYINTEHSTDKNDFISNNELSEILSDFYSPSSLLIISKKYPYNSTIINLDKYWTNDIYGFEEYMPIYNPEYSVASNEIVYIDYVRNVNLIKNKLSDVSNIKDSITLNLKNTPSNIRKSDELTNIDISFTNLYKHNNCK